MNTVNYDKLRSMIARCEWTFAKSMPFAPHEYIVRDKCPLTDDEFVYFVEMQRQFGIKERWGRYNNPYLYIDGYKYWTMGAPMEGTKVINRAKACAVNEAHQLYNVIEQAKKENNMEHHQYIDAYVHKHLGLKDDDNGYNINLLSGRLEELSACVKHLERIRRNYSHEVMKDWSEQLAKDFPGHIIVEDLGPANIVYTGITLPYKDITNAMTVRIQIAYKSLYYGLTYLPETQALRDEMQKAMWFINEAGDFIKGSDWLYYKYVSFEEGYECLKELTQLLIDRVLMIINNREDAIRMLERMDVETSNKSEEEINLLINDHLGIDFTVKELPTINFSNVVVPKDTEFSESHIGPTPSGGAYSTAYFYDDQRRPCRREKASYMNIVEYSAEGYRINEHYGFCGSSSKDA